MSEEETILGMITRLQNSVPCSHCGLLVEKNKSYRQFNTQKYYCLDTNSCEEQRDFSVKANEIFNEDIKDLFA